MIILERWLSDSLREKIDTLTRASHCWHPQVTFTSGPNNLSAEDGRIVQEMGKFTICAAYCRVKKLIEKFTICAAYSTGNGDNPLCAKFYANEE